MMRRLILCFLAGTSALALGQAREAQSPTAPAQPGATQSKPALLPREGAPATVAPDAPVLTVHGLCIADTAPASKANVPAAKDCVITVTKEQFDKLLNAFNPNKQAVTPQALRQLGQSYVELLTFSEAAKAAGVESSPVFAEVMRVLRLKALSDFYRTQLSEQFRNPSPEEVENYYRNNASKYEGAKLGRIYVPRNDPDPQATPEQKTAFQKKAEQLANDAQTRAAKGEDLDKLQKETYGALGISAPPPSTDLSTARHGMFPPKLDQEIFSHKPGEVFRSDDGNGYMVYRVESRQPIPFDSVKEEIARELSRHKMEEKIKELTAPVHADFNEAYFGPARAEGATSPTTRPPTPNPSR